MAACGCALEADWRLASRLLRHADLGRTRPLPWPHDRVGTWASARGTLLGRGCVTEDGPSSPVPGGPRAVRRGLRNCARRGAPDLRGHTCLRDGRGVAPP